MWRGDETTTGKQMSPSWRRAGVTAIAAGESSTVALRNNGTVVAWGGVISGTNAVAAPEALSDVMAIAAGGEHIVALKTDGSVVAWGWNAYGQTNVPIAARSGVVAVAAGGERSVALKNPFDISLSGFGATAGGTTGLPLAQAMDASGLTWTTGGDANWIGQGVTTHDGVSAARSGSVADGQETWLQTTVMGPGTLRFWWKVDSAENFDCLDFEVDGAKPLFISGSVAWEEKIIPIATGNHTLR